MAFWDNTGDADGSSSGNYFTGVGEYDVVIEAVKHKAANEGFRGESVIVEVRVLASNNPVVAVGTSKSCAWNITKHKNMALNNIKTFVCGVYGWPDSAKDEPTKAKINHVAKRMVEADNPLGGVKVHLTTWTRETAKGGEFTNLDWSPYTADGYAAPTPSGSANLNGGHVAPPAAPKPPPPPPPPAASGNKSWRRENGYRLNPATNAWEIDT